MKGVGIIVTTVFFALVNAENSKIYYDLRDAPFLFHKFVREYNREYKNTPDLLEHYAAFTQNLVVINEANKRSTSATFDINLFADYTEEEEKSMLGSLTYKVPDVRKVAAKDRRPVYAHRARHHS